MEEERRVELPLKREDIRTLRAGDRVRIFGAAYMAGNAVHRRLAEQLKKGEALALDLFGASLYYADMQPGGIPGMPITGERLDVYTPMLIRKGLTAMIGRGGRLAAVVKAMQRRAVYFAFTGTAEDINRCLLETEIVALEDLGQSAVRRIHLMGLPAVVAADAYGGEAQPVKAELIEQP